MYPPTPGGNGLDAYGITYAQPGSSALATDDDPHDYDPDLYGPGLQALPVHQLTRDRTRRSSRPSTVHSTRSKSIKSVYAHELQVVAPIDHVPVLDTHSDKMSSTSRSKPPSSHHSHRDGHNSDHRKRLQNHGFIHFVVLCCAIYGEGWNDGSTGPLLPAFQRTYSIGYLVVSLYFVANCIGFIIGGALNIYLNERIGFGKIVVIGTSFQLLAYTIQAPGPPFPVMVVANFFTGLGLSLLNAQSNGFVSSLTDNMETKLGILHACYGFGAFSSPFVATYFSGRRRWSFHYLVSASMTILNTLALILVFRFKHLDELLVEGGQAPVNEPPPTNSTTQPRENVYRQVFGLKAVHILTIFAVIYIGVEVTVGGWIVTFIIRERGGGHSSGFISSGFFGGLTVGRLGLMWFNKLVGEHLVIMIYSAIALVLEITIWFVPSIIENAVAVSLVGLVLGPMFPVMVSHASKVLPRWLLTVCIGWITGIGMVGSAALPFLTGVLSSRFGIASLQPLMISMMGIMLLVWAFVPKGGRRID